MRVLTYLIILFLAANFTWYLFREKKLWNQVSAAVILIMLILRLLFIK